MMIHTQDDYAIVIGIDNYVLLRPLKTAGKDALAFAEWLASADGGRLPKQNIQVLLSPGILPPDPFEASPTQMHIDRALRNLGLESNQKIGRRLYFYFAGYGFRSSFDDYGLLMANASIDRLGYNIGLTYYRRYLRECAQFDEIVFILDIVRETAQTIAPLSPPPFTASKSERSSGVKELVIVNGAAPTAFSPDATAVQEHRGLLTRALLEGLRGAASDENGRVTGKTVVQYLHQRILELASETSQFHEPLFDWSSPGELILSDIPADRVVGTLKVEVPHWTAEVRIYDSTLRPVITSEKVKKDPQNPDDYIFEAALAPGIYQVEITLENKSEHQIIVVSPNQIAYIPRKTWKNLQATSTAPIIDGATVRETHITHAERKSRQVTWEQSPGGDSRLFLFVRTQKPEKHRSFADGLRLLDARGKLVTDFSKGTRRNARGGWMAFNADLPSGYYLLRRGRRGVPVRYQPLYLCAGWETHVFLVAHDNYPSLSTQFLGMARLGSGFQAADEATIATEAILDELRKNRKEAGILANEKITELLDGDLENPLLGILTAYILLRQERSKDNSQLRDVLSFLSNTVSDHPDVQALRLRDDEPALSAFWHPPLLLDGLHRVQNYSTHFENAIPLESLTDVVLDNLIVDSPWTAWHELDRTPLYGPEDTATVKKRANNSYTEIFLQTCSPKSPVFRLASLLEEDEIQENRQQKSGSFAAPATVSILHDSAVLQKVQELTESVKPSILPARISLDSNRFVEALLAKVTPEAISAASGLSLNRSKRGVTSLLQTTADASLEGWTDKPLTPDEKDVFEYAWQQSVQLGRGVSQDQESTGVSAPSSDPVYGDFPEHLARSEETPTIEEIASRLRTEANRLSVRKTEVESAGQAQSLAKRLQDMADTLLASADYIAITNAEGHIAYSNGAFLSLLVPETKPADVSDEDPKSQLTQAHRERLEKQRAWEARLKNESPGENEFPDPVSATTEREWVLQRTVIEDETMQKEQAYLNVLRRVDKQPLAIGTLDKIETFLSDLTFYASMFAYGSEGRESESIEKLGKIVNNIDNIISTQSTKT